MDAIDAIDARKKLVNEKIQFLKHLNIASVPSFASFAEDTMSEYPRQDS
jgi:hypothetical protein